MQRHAGRVLFLCVHHGGVPACIMNCKHNQRLVRWGHEQFAFKDMKDGLKCETYKEFITMPGIYWGYDGISSVFSKGIVDLGSRGCI